MYAVAGDVFAGLFAYGIRRAGFRVDTHLAHTDYGIEMYKANFKSHDVRIGKENWDLSKLRRKERPHLFFTNPPCAPWSNAGHGSRFRKGEAKDDRPEWIIDLMNAAFEMRADTWVWESVTEAWRRGQDFVLSRAEECLSHGYSVTVLLQNNLYLGAPQNRRRMLFIAHRYPIVFPRFKLKHPTVREVLKGVSPGSTVGCDISPKEWSLYSAVGKEGGPLSAHYSNKMTDKERKRIDITPGMKPSFLARRLANDKTCPVFIKNTFTYHPTLPRYTTWNEGLALAGAPKTWKRTASNLVDNTHLLGRGVLPAVGKWIGTAVATGIKTGSRIPKRERCVMLCDFRKMSNIIEERIDL